ncbi:MAG: trehalose-phosphatase [Pseudomonadota bacterium]|jgi:trehalose 6-phosphate phosphatase
MQEILSSAGLQRLTQFFVFHPMVVFDFDGTLAELSQLRDGAKLTELTRALLGRLSEATGVGVVSGRSLSDLSARLSGLDRLVLAGNHGGEFEGPGAEPYLQVMQEAEALLGELLQAFKRSPLLQDLPHEALEHKGLSLTFHWRAVPSDRARLFAREVRQISQAVGDFRVIPGTESLSLIPRGLSDKGEAALSLLEASRRTHLVYIGDEETDEDVFRKARGERFLGIRVGQSDASAAEWYVREQAEVNRLLEVFLALVTGAAAATTVGLGSRGAPGAVTAVDRTFS